MIDRRNEILKIVKTYNTASTNDIVEMMKPNTVNNKELTKFLLDNDKVELKSINIDDGMIKWEWKGER